MLAATTVKILSVVYKDICIYAWTDYALVLQWLAQLPKTWTTFVANRVAQIQTILPQSNWNHVSSVENPADIASRGFSASHLVKSSLWWIGPAWWLAPEDNWPDSQPNYFDPPEKRKNVRILLSTESDDEIPIIGPSHYSCLGKTIRIKAYVLYLVGKLRKTGLDKPLDPQNLILAK